MPNKVEPLFAKDALTLLGAASSLQQQYFLTAMQMQGGYPCYKTFQTRPRGLNVTICVKAGEHTLSKCSGVTADIPSLFLGPLPYNVL